MRVHDNHYNNNYHRYTHGRREVHTRIELTHVIL